MNEGQHLGGGGPPQVLGGGLDLEPEFFRIPRNGERLGGRAILKSPGRQAGGICLPFGKHHVFLSCFIIAPLSSGLAQCLAHDKQGGIYFLTG